MKYALAIAAILLTTPALACVSHDGLPDSTCTPGAIDPRVTQENLKTTICVKGYSKTVRPPVSFTAPRKLQSIRDYGYADTNPHHYEYDHQISLENGGNPTAYENLWAEPMHVMVNGEDLGFKTKDRVENEIHREICKGIITLKEGQQILAHDWVACYHRMLQGKDCNYLCQGDACAP